MPTVPRYSGIRFPFFSNGGSPREPMHVHASRDGGEAKLWLFSEVALAGSSGFDRRSQAELLRLVAQPRDLIARAWHEHFG